MIPGNGENDVTRREFTDLAELAKDTNDKVTSTDLTVMQIKTRLDDFMAQHILCQKRSEDDRKGIRDDYKRRFGVMYAVISSIVLGFVIAFMAHLFGKG